MVCLTTQSCIDRLRVLRAGIAQAVAFDECGLVALVAVKSFRQHAATDRQFELQAAVIARGLMHHSHVILLVENEAD